jgi:hypothetical protein
MHWLESRSTTQQKTEGEPCTNIICAMGKQYHELEFTVTLEGEHHKSQALRVAGEQVWKKNGFDKEALKRLHSPV